MYAEHPAEIEITVCSSAAAEDLPTANFAEQQDSFLNVRGEAALLRACQKWYVSLFNDRAVKYSVTSGFYCMCVALSMGMQRMVRSVLALVGVTFPIEPETGHANLIHLTGSWDLGENVV